MKHNNTFFMQVSREIWNYDISDNAKMLFFWLNELEQRYTDDAGKTPYFYRTDSDLAKDLGWSDKTLRNAKKELKNTDLIDIRYMHWWLDDKHTKKSPKHVTAYRILK